jgi:hypothetical protein
MLNEQMSYECSDPSMNVMYPHLNNHNSSIRSHASRKKKISPLTPPPPPSLALETITEHIQPILHFYKDTTSVDVKLRNT